MTTATPLGTKMRARAERDAVQPHHDLYVLADALDTATEGIYSTPQTCSIKQFMVAWARARRVWCDYTGEALI